MACHQVVTPEPSAWAVEHHKWLSDLDNRKRAEKPRHWIDTEKEADEVTSARQWQAADRTTDADRSNDTKSLWRCLDQRLYFVIGGNGKLIHIQMQCNAYGWTHALQRAAFILPALLDTDRGGL